MKKFTVSFTSSPLIRRLGLGLAVTAAVGVLTFAGSGLFAPTSAQAGPSGATHADRQVAELDQLLADFHGALSYGGNLTAMMSLWAEDSSLTLNGVAHEGKDALAAFFTASGYFHNNWVSLAPEYKTQITVHGDTAEATTQCVAVDLTVTPYVVRAVIQANATAKRIDGTWFFTSMNNTSPAPL
jgi:hypothetical protein